MEVKAAGTSIPSSAIASNFLTQAKCSKKSIQSAVEIKNNDQFTNVLLYAVTKNELHERYVEVKLQGLLVETALQLLRETQLRDAHHQQGT